MQGAYVYLCRLFFPMRTALRKALSFFALNHLFSKWCSWTISAMVDKARNSYAHPCFLQEQKRHWPSAPSLKSWCLRCIGQAGCWQYVCRREWDEELLYQDLWPCCLLSLCWLIIWKEYRAFHLIFWTTYWRLTSRIIQAWAITRKPAMKIGISRWVSIHIPD